MTAPYDRVWVIARALVRSEDDIPKVVELEKRFRLTPLSRYGTGWRQRYPGHPERQHPTHYSVPTGLRYLDRLGSLLDRFPPPKRDDPILAKLATVGIGPGMKPSKDPRLNADEARPAERGGRWPRCGSRRHRQAYIDGFAAHNGWLVSRTGRYGTNYKLERALRRSGSAPWCRTSRSIPSPRSTTPVRISPGRSATPCISTRARCRRSAPSSVSLYDLDGFFVPNPIDRYLINDRTDLHFNPDGSLDVYIQHAEPSSPLERQNWLPAPTGGFRLLMRMYARSRRRSPGSSTAPAGTRRRSRRAESPARNSGPEWC